MPIKVRTISFFDLGQLINMQEAHRNEMTLYPDIIFNRELCTENMARFMQDPNHLILVAHKEDSAKILGYIWLARIQPHYTEAVYYSEMYTYIIPEYRNASVMFRLLNKAKVISKLSGASFLQVGNFSANDKLSQAYHKRYKLIGETFHINL